MALRRREDGVLELGGVALTDVVRDARVGTPSYVYDLDAMAGEARALEAAFDGAPHLVAYAVKANSAGPVVRRLAAEGCGADVVSGAELMLALGAGVSPDRIVYSGVAKTDDEIDRAIASGPQGIGAVQVESVEEISRIAARAEMASRSVRVSLRINPGVDADALDTHDYIATGHDDAKFGVPIESVHDACNELARHPNLRLVGVGAHVGSQFTSVEPYLASARILFDIVRGLRPRFQLSYVDTGGGFGIDYGDGCAVRPADFVRETRRLQREAQLDDLALYCEPGRSLVGAHGVLLARVVLRKAAGPRHWTMIDAGMNDLMRPALYQARHRVWPLAVTAGVELRPSRVVGPVCESSDDFGVHELPVGDVSLVALLDAGAYGYSMASCYNGRALPAEVFLAGGMVAGVTSRRAPDEWVSDRLRAG